MFPANRIYIFTLTVTLAAGQLINFDNGKIGVNFAGFHASAGLGGLLNGDFSKGGLHAEAGTPFGQHARAGLSGGTGKSGAAGGLYADATATGGVSAAAALGGATGDFGSVGQSVAGATAGGQVSAVEKTSISHPVSALHVEKTVSSVPVQPIVVEKTVYRPHKKYAHVNFESHVNTQPAHHHAVKAVEISHAQPIPPPVTVHKYVSTGPVEGGGGFLAKLFAGLNTGAGGSAHGEVHASTPVKRTEYSSSGSVATSGLFNDIFNIPISTLHAVNKLVNNFAGGGSVSVTKTAHTY